jgi:hypothetical protein
MRSPSGFLAYHLTIACVVTVSGRALAFGGSARELERQGTFVITNNADFKFDHQFGQGDATSFALRPALDYFVIPNLSLGGAIEIDITSGNPTYTNFGIAPDVGYEFALSDTWSFWPSLALQMNFPSRGNATAQLNVFAPFLVHPAQHFFFGIGPGLSQGLTSNPTTHLLGGFSLGGYFDH